MKTAILFSLVLIAVSLNYAFAAKIPDRHGAVHSELKDFKNEPEQNNDGKRV